MKKNDPVKSIMSNDIVSASLNHSFSEVKGMMEENKVHHIPVLEGETLIGIVSRFDILKFSHSREYIKDGAIDSGLDSSVKIEKLMTHDPVYIKSNDTVKHAVEILVKNSFNSVPVVENENKKLVGIVTTKDILSYLMHQY